MREYSRVDLAMEQRQGRGGAFYLTPRPLGVLAALFVALATLAPTPSVAYHDTRSRSSAGGDLPLDLPLDVIVPIVVVVAVGIVALGVWSRKKPKGKVARRRARKRRKTDGRRA